MAFSKAQFEITADRLKDAVNRLVSDETKRLEKPDGKGWSSLYKAARAKDPKAILACIDAEEIIRMAKRGVLYTGTDLVEIVKGKPDADAVAKAIKPYQSKLQAITRHALDIYLSDGQPIEVYAVIAELEAVAKP